MGVFNGDSIYNSGGGGGGQKSGAGIYNGDELYNDVKNENWNVIYLTYFENYDELNHVDTPEVGQPANYNAIYGILNYETLEYNGQTLKCITATANDRIFDNEPNTYYGYGPIISLPENIKKLKIDTIINAFENRSDFSSLFCGSLKNTNEWDSNDFFLDPQFDMNNPKQFGPYCGGNAQFKSGWEGGGFGANWLKLPYSYNGVSFKRTYILDYENAENNLETYINDVLAAVGTYPITYKEIHPRGCSRNLGHIIKWTGIKVSVLA